ncbi:hypothetical protein HDU93_008103 [Gonapodya sp. JEL0774]|nr:hypothetical protein HDU93_008103 [Gonapodya sp. JEL0774]
MQSVHGAEEGLCLDKEAKTGGKSVVENFVAVAAHEMRLNDKSRVAEFNLFLNIPGQIFCFALFMDLAEVLELAKENQTIQATIREINADSFAPPPPPIWTTAIEQQSSADGWVGGTEEALDILASGQLPDDWRPDQAWQLDGFEDIIAEPLPELLIAPKLLPAAHLFHRFCQPVPMPLPEVVAPPLPPQSVLNQLVHIHFKRVHPLVFVFSASDFFELAKDPTTVLALQNMSTRFLPECPPSWQTACFERTKGVVTNIASGGKPSLSSLQTMIFVFLYAATGPGQHAADVALRWMGLLVQTARELALNEEDDETEGDWRTSEMRRRTWWCVWILGIIIPVLGNVPPIVFPSEAISAWLVSDHFPTVIERAEKFTNLLEMLIDSTGGVGDPEHDGWLDLGYPIVDWGCFFVGLLHLTLVICVGKTSHDLESIVGTVGENLRKANLCLLALKMSSKVWLDMGAFARGFEAILQTVMAEFVEPFQTPDLLTPST